MRAIQEEIDARVATLDDDSFFPDLEHRAECVRRSVDIYRRSVEDVWDSSYVRSIREEEPSGFLRDMIELISRIRSIGEVRDRSIVNLRVDQLIARPCLHFVPIVSCAEF